MDLKQIADMLRPIEDAVIEAAKKDPTNIQLRWVEAQLNTIIFMHDLVQPEHREVLMAIHVSTQVDFAEFMLNIVEGRTKIVELTPEQAKNLISKTTPDDLESLSGMKES